MIPSESGTTLADRFKSWSFLNRWANNPDKDAFFCLRRDRVKILGPVVYVKAGEFDHGILRFKSQMKNGAPENAVTTPTGTSFPTVRATVSERARRMPPGSTMRDQNPVVRADYMAHDVGGDEPDKADATGNGDGKPGDERTRCKEKDLEAFGVDPEVDCILLSHGKDVELAREDEKSKCGRENDNAHFYIVPGYVPESPHEPEKDLVQVLSGEPHECGENREKNMETAMPVSSSCSTFTRPPFCAMP